MNKNGFLSVLLYKLVIIINLINGKVVLNEKEKNGKSIHVHIFLMMFKNN